MDVDESHLIEHAGKEQRQAPGSLSDSAVVEMGVEGGELTLTPNERLSAQIVSALLERKLITMGDAPNVLAALNTGKSKQEDWSGWMNNGIEANQAK